MRFCTNLRLVAPNKTPTAPRITTTTRISYSMSDETTKTDQSSADTSSVGKAPEKAPDPPEKPLPDDCCGSGCVRCVWDVYYDALEDYNKLVVVANNNVNDDKKDV